MLSHGRAARVWDGLRQILASLRRRYQSSAETRRIDKKRARFWAEVREGRREAEARTGS
jgi:hypothetical protein